MSDSLPPSHVQTVLDEVCLWVKVNLSLFHRGGGGGGVTTRYAIVIGRRSPVADQNSCVAKVSVRNSLSFCSTNYRQMFND